MDRNTKKNQEIWSARKIEELQKKRGENKEQKVVRKEK